ncbi:hypothetical protein LG047_15360 [Methylocystis sp. WRRC1]|uniref:hypothetical protein n=1 Tax=Methylocystis sp. WRRC1 TaxID=1732014 RepID=UPI001D1585A7|nr:hypothetical protein [Methylocystis sp. WRRC1]MCC3246678.1 hypothetical protein [Methylocystis sp. WRRC1]
MNMPTFLEGQQNLSALQVPGVYTAIVPPQPLLTGVPTNMMGVVGVASWGPVNSPLAFSGPDSCSTLFGVPQVRSHDMPSYVWAASQVGSAIGYYGVRVTDGTDTAAQATIQSNCLTLTAKYTGTLGNKIRFQIVSGSKAGSYMAVVSFPGRPPEQFNNIGVGVGSIAVTSGTGYTSVPAASVTAAPAGGINAVINPTLKVVTATVSAGGSGYVVGDTITLTNGVVLTVATVTTGAVATVTITNAGQITGGAAPTNPVTPSSTSGSGTGATFTLAWGLGTPIIVTPGEGYLTAPTVSFTGGGGSGGSYTVTLSIWRNLANAINLGSNQRPASSFVTASPGAGTAAPTLSSVVTLSGGSDGAAGVTDATLVGVDTYPRTGMYALRRTGIDGFTLCDHSTSSQWAAMDVFAMQESCFNAVSTVSGDTISNAVATRKNAALDDFFTWISVGDWPSFYDSQNGLVRQISPTAFMIGWAGNSSPELSPLNKQLRGVVSTQRTQAGQTYSDAELELAETGGVDLIVGPPTTPGGDYFTFICGRNASSNTAANGIEWTRLTNYLARSFQSKAAGSIVGRLQSNRPDDRTRADAKALIDGFLGSLKDPAVGSNGNGIIEDFATVCDLSNNPLILQARGFLFLYAAVKYFNTVRYFIIKLASGGTVDVTSQSTPPQIQQFF